MAYLAALGMQLRTDASAAQLFDGKAIFRFDTFGDEQLWTTKLRLHEAVATLAPVDALGLGLKVDVDALPPAIVDAVTANPALLSDPAVTVKLIELNAVVGVVGRVTNGHLDSIGTTCALCHSTVDNSFAAGIGHRLDGWPNRDLNVGQIIAAAPGTTDEQRGLVENWGPGFFDPRLQAFDGTNFIMLNKTSVPVLIPPAYGLRRVGFETYTGDGPISYWNNYVGVTQMGGHGSFSDPRINLTITQTPDLVTPKLPALFAYQLELLAPEPPKHSFNRGAANRGERVFNGAGRCATCHKGPAFTDVLSGPNPAVPLLHAPAEVGADPAYALRTATTLYRTSPLRGIWQHPPYFHDGSAADLEAVVEHYDALFSLGLSAKQKADLVEYLKSL